MSVAGEGLCSRADISTIGKLGRIYFAKEEKTTQDREWIFRIDKVIRKMHETTENVKRAVTNNEFGIAKFEDFEIFLDKLADRISVECDPAGNVKQIQSPMYVGCSDWLNKRLAEHELLRGMTTSESLCLFLSCLAVLNIKFELVKIPVIKTTEPGLVPLAGNILAWLCGSGFETGGFNAVPSAAPKDAIGQHIYDMAFDEVWKHSWASKNQEKSLEYYRKLLQDYQEMDEKRNVFEQEMKQAEEQLSKFGKEVAKFGEEVKKAQDRLDAEQLLNRLLQEAIIEANR